MLTHSAIYEIRVERCLGPGIAALFPELTLTEGDGYTILQGRFADQSALYGTLDRLRDLGLTLISVMYIADNASSPPPTS